MNLYVSFALQVILLTPGAWPEPLGWSISHVFCLGVTKIRRYLVKENADCGVYPYKDLSQIWQDYMVKRSLVAKTDFWYLNLWLEKGLNQSKFFRK